MKTRIYVMIALAIVLLVSTFGTGYFRAPGLVKSLPEEVRSVLPVTEQLASRPRLVDQDRLNAVLVEYLVKDDLSILQSRRRFVFATENSLSVFDWACAPIRYVVEKVDMDVTQTVTFVPKIDTMRWWTALIVASMLSAFIVFAVNGAIDEWDDIWVRRSVVAIGLSVVVAWVIPLWGDLQDFAVLVRPMIFAVDCLGILAVVWVIDQYRKRRDDRRAIV